MSTNIFNNKNVYTIPLHVNLLPLIPYNLLKIVKILIRWYKNLSFYYMLFYTIY
jgi:hypothetical protein